MTHGKVTRTTVTLISVPGLMDYISENIRLEDAALIPLWDRYPFLCSVPQRKLLATKMGRNRFWNQPAPLTIRWGTVHSGRKRRPL